jgi:hypothetical protein
MSAPLTTQSLSLVQMVSVLRHGVISDLSSSEKYSSLP